MIVVQTRTSCVARREGEHDALQGALRHLAVGDGDAGAGQQPAQLLGLGLDRLDAVVHEEDLAAAVQLAQDGVAHEAGGRFRDPCLDGQPVLRRRLDDAHVAHAHERQVERARDGRGRERQDVHLGLELLEALLVRHAEALLLVDDDQPEVAEADVLAEQAVRADDDVHAARGQPGQRLLLLGAGHEARQRADRDGVGRETLAEGDEVLRGQHRRGHQDRHLRAGLDGLEGGAQGDLRLAVADVADDQAVHGRVALQVVLDLEAARSWSGVSS